MLTCKPEFAMRGYWLAGGTQLRETREIQRGGDTAEKYARQDSNLQPSVPKTTARLAQL
jgi:hypothetical protein